MPPRAPFRNTSAPPRVAAVRRHCRDSDVRQIYRNRSEFGGGGGGRGWWSGWWGDPPEVMVTSTATAGFT